MASGRSKVNFIWVIFKLILMVNGWGISCETALIWTSLDFTDDQSTLVQVMAWCCQATSHCLSPCWPQSLSPYGVTRPQWVKENVVGSVVCNISLMVNEERWVNVYSEPYGCQCVGMSASHMSVHSPHGLHIRVICVLMSTRRRENLCLWYWMFIDLWILKTCYFAINSLAPGRHGSKI